MACYAVPFVASRDVDHESLLVCSPPQLHAGGAPHGSLVVRRVVEATDGCIWVRRGEGAGGNYEVGVRSETYSRYAPSFRQVRIRRPLAGTAAIKRTLHCSGERSGRR